MKLSTKQLTDAKQLHSGGVAWAIIASYLNTTVDALSREIKAPEGSP